MSTLQGDEPELALGDSGEYVTRLQDGLRGLGLFDRYSDGTFDDATEMAVRQLQGMAQLAGDGVVRRDTWEALDAYLTAAAPAVPAGSEYIPRLEHVHPAIQEDARFASFHEFLNERGS
ncbi:MAG TPA: peptidoglycan-binding domain-containing protein [Jatrophihabitans sp.]|jgi:peptidoglycan hydrolase-like protein with peptidoglycan-binding domain|uniref:peptidoglycan-binding domain-containing protein n=1 Tax=Jatrophihabitans sp. TaxID=1932789 RepID=UPI002E09A131|nr:peptidoglycan-binding domain-containing protein [Jatrophihabitans sp.]